MILLFQRHYKRNIVIFRHQKIKQCIAKGNILCMQVLNEFHEISGLQINVEKTKVVKIGAWRDSRTIFCRDLELLWTNKFTSLGIQFDVNNMADITNMNIRS